MSWGSENPLLNTLLVDIWPGFKDKPSLRYNLSTTKGSGNLNPGCVKTPTPTPYIVGWPIVVGCHQWEVESGKQTAEDFW